MNDYLTRERPFQYLKSRKGKEFDSTIVNNWYQARSYVLEKLKKTIIGPCSKKTLSVVVEINENIELMLSVVRHLALAAHYTNYEERDEFGELSRKNSTVIYIVSEKTDIDKELEKEQYLNNLLKYCQYQINGKCGNMAEDLIPIDIDIIITSNMPNKTEGMIYMTHEDLVNTLSIKSEDEIFSIDTQKAILCNNVYNLGAEISNLPYEDIHNISRYDQALNVFKYGCLRNSEKKLISDKWKDNQTEVKNGLSNIFCADRFESIAEGIKECSLSPDIDEATLWEDNKMKLAISEHSRWIVEKLILGYRPLSDKERNRYERLLGDQRKEYVKLLKTNPQKLLEKFHDDYSSEIVVDENGYEHIDPAHINLFTFKELRRIDPDNRKYDSFLMLAIPMILEKANKKVEHID